VSWIASPVGFPFVVSVARNRSVSPGPRAKIRTPAPSPPPSRSRATTTSESFAATAWIESSGATSYKIYRSTSSGAQTLFQSGITTTSFLNTGLTTLRDDYRAAVQKEYQNAGIDFQGFQNLSNDERQKLTAKITAVIITASPRLSPSTIPTAVITESSEKTISSSMI
jgi:hypothetical protein